jgi:hypothetical protein
MRRLLDTALAETATLWPPIQIAFRWVHAAAHVLTNADGAARDLVQRRLERVLHTMRRIRWHLGDLATAFDHFLKVTRSYCPGLFHCYEQPNLPRTNNDLEQLFGQHRHHERRATGRKRAPLSLVLRGSARLVAGVATRLRAYTAADLVLRDLARWRQLRTSIRQRFFLRAQGQRFRRDPASYLAQLEQRALKPSLPT